ncbi:hypothetical protein B0H16DRAFT_1493319 [Mycena metata]|uniref:DUF6534 domain-containing protein n=1 Tax=Mycena metata TaxID=1033252 RepID=A0AAD7KH97_9AGAR|nr:hypothetical protein B0H16DRAFT_1493319 [Mycena metata]
MNSVLSLNQTIGVYEIGVLISFALLGVATTQTYIYYTRFPDDYIKLKTLVAVVWLFEVAHAGCIGHVLYSYTITAYSHPDILIRVPISLGVAIFFAGIITACVQGFFTFRIYAFSKKLFIPVLLWTTILLRLLGSTVILVTESRSTLLADYEARWAWLFMTVWSLSVANDVTITVTLVILLYRRRPDVLQRTTALVDKLIAWTIETGMLTSAVSIVTLTCFITTRESFIFLATFSVTSRLFSNSLLASLNSRTVLRAMNEIPTPCLKLPDDWPTNGGQASKVSELVFVVGSRTTSNGTNIVSRNT